MDRLHLLQTWSKLNPRCCKTRDFTTWNCQELFMMVIFMAKTFSHLQIFCVVIQSFFVVKLLEISTTLKMCESFWFYSNDDDLWWIWSHIYISVPSSSPSSGLLVEIHRPMEDARAATHLSCKNEKKKRKN